MIHLTIGIRAQISQRVKLCLIRTHFGQEAVHPIRHLGLRAVIRNIEGEVIGWQDVPEVIRNPEHVEREVN